jgi:hypothetical protein
MGPSSPFRVVALSEATQKQDWSECQSQVQLVDLF